MGEGRVFAFSAALSKHFGGHGVSNQRIVATSFDAWEQEANPLRDENIETIEEHGGRVVRHPIDARLRR